MFAVLGWFYPSVLPGWLGLPQTGIDVSPWQIAKSVLIFLGIPLAARYLSRRFGEKAKGRNWYENRFLTHIGPWALYGLLFTIVILFALQGHQITSRPWDVARIAPPLLTYFAIMWAGGYTLGIMLRLGYARTATLAFTAAGNNFELAVAVAIATYGATSGQALAGVSQMAAGLLTHLAGDRIEVRSAGTEPAEQINPVAVAAMAELGVDITAATPKILSGDAVQSSDVVITMGCGDTCLYFPGVSYRDWKLPDPAGQPLERVRAIRNDIADRVQALIAGTPPDHNHLSPAHQEGNHHVACSAGPQRRRPRRGNHVLLQAVQHRAGQSETRLRQLCGHRSAAQACAAGKPRPWWHSQPPRCRSHHQRHRPRGNRPVHRRRSVHRGRAQHHLLLCRSR
jgi:arsenate reductase